MSTNDPEFYQAPKFTPEPPPAYLGSTAAFFTAASSPAFSLCCWRSWCRSRSTLVSAIGQQVEIYTGTAPLQLPKVEMPAEQRQTLKDRVEAFRKAVDTGTPTEPLVLTSDDLNALIEEDHELKGKIHAKIKGDRSKGK